jgi:hypothetical protein
VCEIVLDVSNPPSQEVVKFITLAGYNKFDGTVLAGFLMAAADITTTDKYQIVQISDAAFISGTFNSLGHLDYEIYDDGTVMATTQDPLLAMAFISAVISGVYEVRFARPDSNAETRTYKIASAPVESVTSNFTHCMDHLAIESNRPNQMRRQKEARCRREVAAGSASRWIREDNPSLTHVRGGHGQTTSRNMFL